MRSSKIILTLVLISNTFLVFSWGARGHKIVAEIALRSLNQSIVDSVQMYLGDISFQEASVWMDEVRSEPSYDYLKPLHYVNIEKDKTYVRASNKENCVEALFKSIELLNTHTSHTKAEINLALKELFHLMGDIHQPLHCGYAEDKGGNLAQLQFNEKGTNLHKVWDSELIEFTGITLKSCLALAAKLSESEKEQVLKSDVEGIVMESRELLPSVYNFNKRINQEYIDKNKPVIEMQLVKAGLRLANVLNKAFKKD